jgi:hypothetical protein
MQVAVSAERGGRVKQSLRKSCKFRQLFALCKSRVVAKERQAKPLAARGTGRRHVPEGRASVEQPDLVTIADQATGHLSTAWNTYAQGEGSKSGALRTFAYRFFEGSFLFQVARCLLRHP